MFRELVSDPISYFQERVKYPTLKPQSVIVFLAGVAANLWYLGLLITLGAVSGYVENVVWVMSGVGILAFFILWLILTAIMNFLVMILGGEPSYGRLLRLTGYGFLPMIVGGVIWSAGRLVALQSVPPPEKATAPRFGMEYANFQKFVEPAHSDPVFIGAIAAGSVFVLISGYLWMLAVQVTAGLERDRAVIIAGIPTALYVLWVFFPII